jgi:hypothetical protein
MSDMTWTRRLLALATGRGTDELAEEIGSLSAGFGTRAAMLAEAADLAPHEAAEGELRRLSAEQAAMAERIRAGATEHSLAVPVAPPSAEPAVRGSNHWGRLVRLLELHQQVREELRESSFRIAERRPELAPLFADSTRLLDVHLARLRGLIAQADPHALD